MKMPTWDQVLDLYRLWKGDTVNKIALALVLGGVGAVTGWGQQAISAVLTHYLGKDTALAGSPIWVGIFLITAGVGLVIWNEHHKRNKSPEPAHPNDVALLVKFRELTPDHFQEFLRDHDFGNTFRRKNLDPLDVLAYDWKGARYEFVDKEVQKKFHELRQSVFEFLKVAEPRIYPHHINPEMATTLTDMDRAREISKSTLDAIKAMNQRASVVYGAIQEFERVAVLHIDGRACS